MWNSVPIKENNKNGTMITTRSRTAVLMGISGFWGVFILLLVVCSSSIAPDSADSSSLLSSSSSSSGLVDTSDHRHPFVRPQRRRTLFSGSEIVTDEPRYLVFGTSSTYGIGLENPLEEAYPYRLSEQTHNAATQSGGFTLAAACMQSIVRDNIYDVIIFEFRIWDPALSMLVQRARQRFPHAFLVLLRLWHPSQLQYKQDNGTVIDFHTYQKSNGYKGMDDPELYLSMLARKDRWSFATLGDEAVVLEEASRYRASYFAMNMPDHDFFEYPKTMMDQLSIFQEDSDNLNAQGHAIVSSSLRQILQGHKPVPRNQLRLGSWGEGDECRLWYENGLYHDEKDTQRLRRVVFEKSGNGAGGDWFVGANHKHAMEVNNEMGGTLKIDNPFDGERMLYLTYLTTPAEAEDEEEYSQLRVRINDKPAILIEAFHTAAQGQELARTSASGLLPPGSSLVQLDPVLSRKSTRPFRLLGWSLLSQEVEGRLALEFSLEESRVPVEEYWNWFSR